MRPRNKKQNRWEDHYSQKAKSDGYSARSVYKLKEIQHKFRLIKKGHKVLDLGCFPGSWLIYQALLVGNRGQVVGVDIKPVTIQIPTHAITYTADISTLAHDWWSSLDIRFNVVTSDMMATTTGNKDVNAARSLHLCQEALAVTDQVLITGGSFVCKIFWGQDFNIFLNSVKIKFNRYRIFKPQSSRKTSSEIYIIGLEKIGGNNVRTQ